MDALVPYPKLLLGAAAAALLGIVVSALVVDATYFKADPPLQLGAMDDTDAVSRV